MPGLDHEMGHQVPLGDQIDVFGEMGGEIAGPGTGNGVHGGLRRIQAAVSRLHWP